MSNHRHVVNGLPVMVAGGHRPTGIADRLRLYRMPSLDELDRAPHGVADPLPMAPSSDGGLVMIDWTTARCPQIFIPQAFSQ